MALPEPLRSFWYAFERFNLATRRTRWGLVATDVRFPQIYDANKACVLETVPDLTLAEIRAELHPAIDEAGIAFEHIEVMDLADRCPALDELEATDSRDRPEVRAPDAVMVYQGDGLPRPAAGVVVQELVEPDEAFWRVYGESRGEFGAPMGEEVVDQLVRRDRDVVAPNGLRFFVATIGGSVAGFTTLISLAGAGYVDNVVTLPEHRRRGVASATIADAVRASVARGDRPVFLLATEGSDAQRLYERLGFALRYRADGFTVPRTPGPDRSPFL